jgi:multiple sugar transport system substrate-binding protein
MRRVAFIVAALLAIAPLCARAADLVVWWEKGYYDQEDKAVADIVAAFEQGSGKQVELTFKPQDEFSGEIVAALQSGAPPDFAFGVDLHEAQWAFDDRLIDLSEAVGHFSNLFDGDALDRGMLINGTTGQKSLYGLPVGLSTNQLHVWKSLLERAGFKLDDIPREWAHSGPSGVIRCSRPHARPWAATTFGALACRCRRRPSTPGSNSFSLWLPTKRIT